MMHTMSADLRVLLADLYAQGQAIDATQTAYSQRMMFLEPVTAEMMALLVRASRRRNILEIGTSAGYSTIWLAWAASPHGGQVTSLDREAHKHTQADANLRRAGLRERVTLLTGDATATIASLPGPFDAVFFDADRHSAPRQLELLLPRLTPDALIMHDNATSHPDEIAAYLAAIDALPDVDHVILPIGKGLSVAVRAGS